MECPKVEEVEYIIPEIKMRKMTITGINDVVEGATYVLPYLTKLDNEQTSDKGKGEETEATRKRSSIIFIHGGGFIWGTPQDYAQQVQCYFKSSGVDALYFIDYSLAPQFKFPRGLDECVAISKWIFQHSDELDIDKDQIQMAGDSAGGNLVVATALELLKEKEKYPVKAVHSLCPILQFVHQLPSAFINRTSNEAGLPYTAVARMNSLYLIGDQSYNDIFFQGHYVSAAVVSKFKELVDKHDLRTIRGLDIGLDKLVVSDNEYSKTMEPFLMNWKFNVIFTPEEILTNFKYCNLFLYSCGRDVLSDDAFLFAKLLTSLGVKVDHFHSIESKHGEVRQIGQEDNKTLEAFLSNVKKTL